jgi:hypothetical protein
MVERMTVVREYPAAVRWWPSALGVGAGIAIAAGGGLAAVIMVCAAIYLLAAVTGRPNSAWIGFVASFPLIGVGIVLHQPLLSLAAIGVASVALIGIGLARGTWTSSRNRWQLVGIVAFSAIAVAAALLGAVLISGIVVVVGLLLHAGWDAWHHVRNAVVARPYAEFCAVLDVTVAVMVAVSLVIGGS